MLVKIEESAAAQVASLPLASMMRLRDFERSVVFSLILSSSVETNSRARLRIISAYNNDDDDDDDVVVVVVDDCGCCWWAIFSL